MIKDIIFTRRYVWERTDLILLHSPNELSTSVTSASVICFFLLQAFAVFLPVRSVGVQGDQRTHSHVVALRAVTSTDGMTADWYPFAPEFLRTVSSRIVNRVKEVNRVVYDITSKPPGTIEWE